MFPEIPNSLRLGDPAREDYQFLEDLAAAHWCSEVLFAALELDIFRLLSETDLLPDELAGQKGWDREALGRLLGALEALGLMVNTGNGYANAPLANRFLNPKNPEYLGEFLAYRRYIAPHWKRLPDRIRNGPAANRRPQDESPSDYRQRVLGYVRALDAQACLKAEEASKRLRLLFNTHPRRILDLAGGAGAWAETLTALWPGSTAILLDLPEVIEAAATCRPRTEQKEEQRITRVAGDIFEFEFQDTDFDLIVLSNILHAYGREEACRLLEKAVNWLAPKGRILIHDYLPDPVGGHALKGRLYDLHMLLNTYNGRIHDLGDITTWLEHLGLDLEGIIHLETDSSIILAGPKGDTGITPGIKMEKGDILLLKAVEMGFRQARLIPADTVVTAPWVRQKCRFGCSSFGKGQQCPPFSPDETKMKDMLSCYQSAILLEGSPPGREFHEKLLEMEKQCFLTGFHKALAFGAGPCVLCDSCDTTRPCRLPKQARPSLEACGVDVYQTIRQAGWSIDPVTNPHGYVKYIGLILLD